MLCSIKYKWYYVLGPDKLTDIDTYSILNFIFKLMNIRILFC